MAEPLDTFAGRLDTRDGMLHILTAAGIGDVAWAWSKIHAIADERPVTFWLPNEEAHRSGALLELYGLRYGYMPGLTSNWVWSQPGDPDLPDTGGVLTVQPNRHLESGRRIERWYEHLPFKNPYPKTTATSYKLSVDAPPFVAVSMGAENYMEGNLMPAMWARLLREIERNVAPVLVIGSRRTGNFAEQVLKHFSPTLQPVLMAPLSELLPILKAAKAYVGLASGHTILGAYGGTPTFLAYPHWLKHMPGTWETPESVWDWCFTDELVTNGIVDRIGALAERGHANTTPTFYLLLGGAGSGKSTIAERDYEATGRAVIVDSDLIVPRLGAGFHPDVRQAAKTIAREQFRKCLERQQSVLIPASGADMDGCTALIRQARAAGFRVEAFHVETERETAWEWNRKRDRVLSREAFDSSWDRCAPNIPVLGAMADVFRTIITKEEREDTKFPVGPRGFDLDSPDAEVSAQQTGIRNGHSTDAVAVGLSGISLDTLPEPVARR